MTIKQLGGVFGRNPTFNDVTIEGQLTFDGDIDVNSDLKVDGDLEVTGVVDINGTGLLGTVGDGSFNQSAYLGFQSDRAFFGYDSSQNAIVQSTANKGIVFEVNDNTYGSGSRALHIKSDTDVEVTAGNLIIGTSGKGIDFSATAGTGTSELLDDYEEGVWTSEVGGTATYGDNTGRYTKIGRQVFATFDLNITTIGTGSTTVITGLPFAVGDAIAEGVSINFYDSLATNVVELNAYVINSEIRFRSMSAASSGLTDLAVLGDGCRVTGTAIYTV